MGHTPPYSSHAAHSTPSIASGRVPPILLPDAALDLPVAAAHAHDYNGEADSLAQEELPEPMSIVYSIPEGTEAVAPLRPRMIKSKTDIMVSVFIVHPRLRFD